jgi:hypothetical protein
MEHFFLPFQKNKSIKYTEICIILGHSSDHLCGGCKSAGNKVLAGRAQGAALLIRARLSVAVFQQERGLFRCPVSQLSMEHKILNSNIFLRVDVQQLIKLSTSTHLNWKKRK